MDSKQSVTRFVQPDEVVLYFQIEPGNTVADFGAGGGYFLPALAAAVGGSGRVFVCDIQQNLIKSIGDTIQQNGWDQVSPLWCDIEQSSGISIPDETVDVGVLVNTLFVLTDKTAAAKEIARTIKTGGHLYILDWFESYNGLGPQPDMIVSKESAVELMESTGFALEKEIPAGDHHYGLSFIKL